MIFSIPFYPYHLVRTILSVPLCPTPSCPYTICPYTILPVLFCPLPFCFRTQKWPCVSGLFRVIWPLACLPHCTSIVEYSSSFARNHYLASALVSSWSCMRCDRSSSFMPLFHFHFLLILFQIKSIFV